MEQETGDPHLSPVFDQETLEDLIPIFSNLPVPVILNTWGDARASYGEQEADRLCRALAGRFPSIQHRSFPRRLDYPYYPVIGVIGGEQGEPHDYGVRIIGLPSGYQMTSLVTAVQAVSFQGATLEPATRIRLHKLDRDVSIEVMTAADNEGGPLMAKIVFGMAVASSRVRAYLIMSDMFPEANLRYSVSVIPHTVINGRVHVEGVVDEGVILRHIGLAINAT